MKAAIKRKWIKALRSGEYKQGYQMLKFRGRYCCLGVLNEVCGLGAGHGDGMIRREIAEPLGLSWYVQNKLTSFNDGGRRGGKERPPKSFKWIANWIEKHL